MHDGTEISLGGKWTGQVQPGDRIVIETPGGGGWGVKCLIRLMIECGELRRVVPSNTCDVSRV